LVERFLKDEARNRLFHLKNRRELFIMEEMALEIKNVLDCERLLTARMVDSILRTNQMASYATPEMQDMFNQWLSMVGEQVLREPGEIGQADQKSECDVPALARSIGVSEATIFSLLAYMHRSGRIRVETVRFSKGDGKNSEICSCLTQ
jgi:hypothetical protein